MKNFNITVDYRKRRVWLENITGLVGGEVIGEPGFMAGYDPRKRVEVIFSVSPGGPADRRGEPPPPDIA